MILRLVRDIGSADPYLITQLMLCSDAQTDLSPAE